MRIRSGVQRMLMYFTVALAVSALAAAVLQWVALTELTHQLAQVRQDIAVNRAEARAGEETFRKSLDGRYYEFRQSVLLALEDVKGRMEEVCK